MCAFIGALLVLVLLTATLQGSSAVTASSCRIEPNRTLRSPRTPLCYGALGGTVFLHLDMGREVADIHVKKGFKPFLKYKSQNYYENANRLQVFNNGTWRLDRALKNDSEIYNVDVFNKLGKLLWNSIIHLIIQGPLSKPTISQQCLPHGEVRVSCSSDGDVTEYSWSVGNKPLDGSVADLKEKDTVILKKSVPGDITCSVWNNFSSNLTTVRLFTCPAVRTCILPNGTEATVIMKTTGDFQPLLNITEVAISVDGRVLISAICSNTSLALDLGGWDKITPDTHTGVISVGIMVLSLTISAVFSVFVLMAAVVCLTRARNKTAITGKGHDTVPELVYTEVVCHSRVKSGRGREQEKKSEVIYAKIAVPERPDHLQGRTHGQEDAVYASV